MANPQRAWRIPNPLIIIIFSLLLVFQTGCNSSLSSEDLILAATQSTELNEVQITPDYLEVNQEDQDAEPLPTISTSIIEEAIDGSDEVIVDEIQNIDLYEPFFSFPISDEYSQKIESSYRFGSTLFGERMPHDGVEILNPLGTPVLAAADGIVYFSGNDLTKKWGKYTNLYGNFIIIEHQLPDIPTPIYTLYAHLSELIVVDGEKISNGQTIGLVGATGKAFTNHLHFEVRVGDIFLQNARNPELFLPLIPSNDEPVGLLIGSLLSKDGNLIPGASIVLQKIIDDTPQAGSSVYIETYAKGISGDEFWRENFVLSNLPEGDYRISAYANQYFIEEFITINANEIKHLILQPEE
jgi:hypothetical protein